MDCVFAGCTFTPQAEQNDYYSCFTNSIGTPSGIVQVKDPSLLNTNNTGVKLTNAIIDLEHFSQTGEISGMRVGMTMDEAIAAWGKPRAAINHCVMALATFWYNDAALAFDGNELEVVRIYSQAAFRKGLSTSSAPDDFIRVFGSPTRRFENDGAVVEIRVSKVHSVCRVQLFHRVLSAHFLAQTSYRPVNPW